MFRIRLVLFAIAVILAACPQLSRAAKSISISGMIVDENGKPVDGVECQADLFKASGWEGEFSKRTDQVDSSFELEYRNVHGVTLTFSKVGYRPAKYNADTIMRVNAPTVDGRATVENLKMVLVRIGRVSPLDHYELRVSDIAEGPSRALRLDGFAPQPRTYTGIDIWRRQQCRRLVLNAGAKDLTTAALAVQIVPTTAPRPAIVADGRIIMPRDRDLRLTFDDGAGGGIIILPTPPTGPNTHIVTDESCFDTMREAPVDGYSQCVVFSPDRLRRLDDGFWFYARINGLYSKGKMRGWVRIHDDRMRTGLDVPLGHAYCDLEMEVYLQPNGTPYLESTLGGGLVGKRDPGPEPRDIILDCQEKWPCGMHWEPRLKDRFVLNTTHTLEQYLLNLDLVDCENVDDIRLRSVELLGSMGARARPALPALRRTMEQGGSWIARPAADAIKQIERPQK